MNHYCMNNQWKNEREGYKWSEKNAPDEKPDEKQKLHESKAGGSGQRRLEHHKPAGNNRRLEEEMVE